MCIYLDKAIVPLVHPHWQLSTVSLPVLVSMDLTAVAGLSSQWIPSYLPSLQHLTLRRLSVAFTHLPLPQLTSLELHDLDFRSRDLASLLDVLKTCTSLQRFVFADTEDMPFNVSSVAAGYRVSLPHIRRSCITAASADTSSLLAHVLLAKQTHLLLYPNDFLEPRDWSDRIPVLHTFLLRDTAYWPAMKDVTHIMVWWDECDLTVCADRADTEFWESHPWRSLDLINMNSVVDELSPPPPPALVIKHIKISWPHPIAGPLLSVVKELGDFFPASAKTLVLRGIAEDIPKQIWAETLAKFPAIEHFEIVAEEDAMCAFPLALRPTSSGFLAFVCGSSCCDTK
ncbi:uncharacterized protein B0H18DRAFT_1123770 [Fomitopsis serialis]|uniref:uncharacterized protein n=1 Tax=Fomitopsis serialis TaxID=139415 RepID=UPI002008D9B9|nr:uncharacterized protein B0H18DRAFT_1123770 [Neoantrodia serialis]KAH9917174.1 hypothetical protein B0H18DRAFT_1123770 [Neoantrodia serialis]